MMEKRWILKQVDEEKVARLQQELKIHPVHCRLLIERGIETFEAAKTIFPYRCILFAPPFFDEGYAKGY
jgi:hypothetical protein